MERLEPTELVDEGDDLNTLNADGAAANSADVGEIEGATDAMTATGANTAVPAGTAGVGAAAAERLASISTPPAADTTGRTAAAAAAAAPGGGVRGGCWSAGDGCNGTGTTAAGDSRRHTR